jgi:hypothetical protein
MHMAALVPYKDVFTPPSLLLPPPPSHSPLLNVISRPARHFRPPLSPPPEDYGQILAASPKVEDGLHFGDCKYDS